MQKILRLKKLTIILLTVVSLLIPITKAQAVDTLTYDKVFLDTTIVRNSTYKLPSNILVVPLTLPDTNLKINDTKWYRGIYYYTIDRLGFSNMPFHYIVSSKGEVYKATQGDERKISIEDLGDENIIVGYLATPNVSVVDAQAETSMKEILLEIANKNSINPNRISVTGLQFTKDPSTRQVSIKSKKVFGNWERSINSIVNAIKGKYAPQPKTYIIEVGEIKINNTEALPGQEVSGNVTLKNTGEFALYGGTRKEIVVSKVGKGNSSFFLNNSWLSTSQFGLMKDDELLMPGEEKTYSFTVRTPLYYGVRAETFELKTLDGQVIQSDNFRISIDIKRGGKPIIQINNTETNYLRVRETPSTVSKEISRVASGDRFFVLEENPNGFIKIDLGDGRTGWVAGWMTTRV